MKILIKTLSIIMSLSLIIAMTISETAIAKTTEPTAAYVQLKICYSVNSPLSIILNGVPERYTIV